MNSADIVSSFISVRNLLKNRPFFLFYLTLNFVFFLATSAYITQAQIQAARARPHVRPSVRAPLLSSAPLACLAVSE